MLVGGKFWTKKMRGGGILRGLCFDGQAHQQYY
jgi:hypothetical protein